MGDDRSVVDLRTLYECDSMDKLGKILAQRLPLRRKRGNCLPEERLAVFAGGHAETQERVEILSHVASCRRCREITGAALAEEPPALRFPGRLKRGGFATVALPLLAASLFLAVWLGQPHRPPSLEGIIASLTAWEKPEVLNRHNAAKDYALPIYGFNGGLPVERAAFLAGTLAAGLEMAVRAKDGEKALRFAAALSGVAPAVTANQDLQSAVRNCRRKIGRGQFPDLSELNRHLIAAAQGEGTDFYFLFGAWARAAELAAKSRRKPFFQKKTVAFYREKSQEKGLPVGVGRNLSRILRAVEKESWDVEDYRRVAGLFGEILEILT